MTLLSLLTLCSSMPSFFYPDLYFCTGKKKCYAFIYNDCQFHMIWGNVTIIILLINSIKIYNWELIFKAGKEKWRKVFQDVRLGWNFWKGNACMYMHVCMCECVCLCVCVSIYLMMGFNTTLISLLLGVPPQYT